MVTIGVIGLGTFGCRVVEELSHMEADIIIVDRNRDVIEKYKDVANDAYITDAINEETLKRIFPSDIDSVVIDLGDQLESCILVTNLLSKMNVQEIVVKAKTEQQGEILKLVGATTIVYPDLDAAMNITPLLVSSVMLNYMQISEELAIAEIVCAKELVGKTLAQSGLRQVYNLNLMAYRTNVKEKHVFVNSPSLILKEDMLLLVAGSEKSIQSYVSKIEADTGVLSKKFKKASLISRVLSRG